MKWKDCWLIVAVVLGAAAGALLLDLQGTPAMAQGKGNAGGVIAIPFQVNGNQEALCLVDTANTVICVYELNTRGKTAIELKGARDYSWDVQVRRLNTEPPPDKVRLAVEKQLKDKK